jgi:hypothetical protein
VCVRVCVCVWRFQFGGVVALCFFAWVRVVFFLFFVVYLVCWPGIVFSVAANVKSPT